MANSAAAPLLAAFLAAFLLGCAQTIPESKVVVSCVGETMESIKSGIQSKIGASPNSLSGEEAEIFMVAFNRTPPPTKIDANEVMFLVSPADGRTMIIMGRDGCLVQTAYSLWRFIEKWRQGIIPQPDGI